MNASIERIGDLNDALARGDVEAAAELMHPDVVWEHNLGAGTPEEGVYEGRDSVRALITRLVEGWAYQRPEPGDIREVEPDVYFLTGELHSKHPESDNEIVSPYRQRLEFRDGRVAKTRVSTGAEAAKIAVVRRFVEAFNRRDPDSVRAEVHPDVELHEWPTGPDPASYRGADGVRQAIDTWFETWEWMRVEIVDIQDTGEAVFLKIYQRAKGKGSEAEVELTSYSVYSFRDGLVSRIELFTEREPALAAAGLTPEKEEEKR